MIALDFFLYDNQTLSAQWGRDWGLKAATGVLANRADLKVAFDRYCGAMLDAAGQLCAFGETIGGIRPRNQNGYLLCVTLETAGDSFGRGGWATYGLWCPDTAVLDQVLSAGDPIASARAVHGMEPPPAVIEIRPAAVAIAPRRSPQGFVNPVFHRFEQGATARQASGLLLGAIRSGTAPPNILGITSTAKLAAVAREYQVVYSHPVDDDTERILARVLSPDEPEEEWEIPPAAPAPPPARVVDSPAAAPSVPPPRGSVLPWLAIGVGIALVLWLGSLLARRPAPAREPAVETAAPPETLPAEAALREIERGLKDWDQLTPAALRQSPGFLAAENLEVLRDYQRERDRVRRAYASLLEVRGRVVKRQGNYVAYYFNGDGRTIPAATKLEKIGAILNEAPLGGEDCRVLARAFGSEFENEDSVVRRWCHSVRSLETTSRRLRPPP